MTPFADLTAAGSFWLKNWAERNTEAGTNPEIGKYIGIYFAFGIGAAALTVVQTLILWIFCSIEVGRCMMKHRRISHRADVYGLGIAQVTREDGNGNFQSPNVFL